MENTGGYAYENTTLPLWQMSKKNFTRKETQAIPRPGRPKFNSPDAPAVAHPVHPPRSSPTAAAPSGGKPTSACSVAFPATPGDAAADGSPPARRNSSPSSAPPRPVARRLFHRCGTPQPAVRGTVAARSGGAAIFSGARRENSKLPNPRSYFLRPRDGEAWADGWRRSRLQGSIRAVL